ncbi:hypothetical protein QTP86_011522 [Hemibagrus guttatus]|nr:hypothetical protein QTP86_011522 [Hemibagrus guttatus]
MNSDSSDYQWLLAFGELLVHFCRNEHYTTTIHEVQSQCEDSFELHSVDLEREAVEKQIRDLQVKQAQLRQRKAALESSRTDAPLSQPGCSSSGRRDPKPRARTSPPPPPPVFEIPTQNRFAPLRETECDTVIIGDSIVRHVRATAAKGKVPAILKKNIGAVVLHAGTNDIGLRQTEILKKDFRSLVELVRTTSPTTRIIVSGPLPTFQRGIERPASPCLFCQYDFQNDLLLCTSFHDFQNESRNGFHITNCFGNIYVEKLLGKGLWNFSVNIVPLHMSFILTTTVKGDMTKTFGPLSKVPNLACSRGAASWLTLSSDPNPPRMGYKKEFHCAVIEKENKIRMHLEKHLDKSLARNAATNLEDNRAINLQIRNLIC